MKVIVGLGNPGKKYEHTRHNVGFAVIDSLGEDYGIEIIRAKHKALMGDRIIKGEKLMLVKPMTFMNLSGESAAEIINFYKLELEDIIVICDDVSIPFGSIRVRERGSDGGHNGIKSIINHIGSQEFTRVRIGIGEAPESCDLADYVLAKLSEDEKIGISTAVKNATECVRLILESSAKDAMNKYNKRNKAPEQTKQQENSNEWSD